MTPRGRSPCGAALRILYTLPALVTGGAETQAVRLAAGLRDRGHDVRIGVLRGGGELEPWAAELGVPVHTFPRTWRHDPVPIIEMADFLRAHRVDVVHAWLFLDGLYARPAAMLSRRTAVVASAVGVEYGRRSVRARLDAQLARWSDAIFANSQWMADRFAEAGVRRGDIRVLDNLVDFDWLDEPADVIDLPGEGPVVGAVGRLHPVKDHATFLDACARVALKRPGVRFLLAGEGECRPALAERAGRLGLTDRLAMPGRVADVRRILPRIDVFAHTSRHESLPNALLEAMAFGRPCVATCVGGVPEVLEHGRNGLLVPPGDPDALADAVLHLLDRPMHARRLGDMASDTVRERFRPARVLDSYERLYREVARR